MSAVIRRSLHSLAASGPLLPKTLTPIQSFYSGKDVFITGATGFMGKILVEKLLWSCPDIGNIYILGRSKKGQELQNRIDDLVSTEVFERVRRDVPGFREKIKIMEGDCSKPGLGLSEADKDILINQVNIVFHVAAALKFFEPLKFSTAVNVRATRDLLQLSRSMKDLKSFIHVSTTFSQSHSDTLDEVFYDSPVDSLNLIDFVETSNPEIVEKVTPIFQGKWRNIYTFTKSLGEDAVRQCGVGLPAGIFRPSIVTPSRVEPQPRWIDNWNGFTGYLFYAGNGLIRALWCTKESTINIVPVDMSINGLIASAWDVAESFQKRESINSRNPTAEDITIYNYALVDNPVRISDCFDMMRADGAKYPSLSTVHYHSHWKQSGLWTHKLAKLLLHYVPAVVNDTLLLCTGKKPKYIAMYKRFDIYEDAVLEFMNVEWKISNNNIKKMISKMTEDDRKLFPCDVRDIEWKKYFDGLFLGMRRYLIEEDDSTLPAAKKKYNRLHIQHCITQLLLLLVLGGGAVGTYESMK